MRRLLQFAILALIATACQAQQITRTPIDKIDWALLGGDVLFRGLDVYSTNWMLHHGGREDVLPDVISHHVPVMSTYSGTVVAVTWFAMRRCERRHSRLARLGMLGEIGGVGYSGIHNLYIKPSFGPRSLVRK